MGLQIRCRRSRESSSHGILLSGLCGMPLNLLDVITQQKFGYLVGISQQRVSDLIARGVLVDGATCGDWLCSYCGHLREISDQRASALDLATERARHAQELADRLAMQNAVTRAELVPVHLLEKVLARAGAKISTILGGIPVAIRQRAPGLPENVGVLIAAEVDRVAHICGQISLAAASANIEEPDDDGLIDPSEPHEPI